MEFNRAKKDFLFFKNSRIHSFKKKIAGSQTADHFGA